MPDALTTEILRNVRMTKSAVANLFSTASFVPCAPIVRLCASRLEQYAFGPSWLSSLSASAIFL
eukprot:2400818-Prymnesium_polylepis.1